MKKGLYFILLSATMFWSCNESGDKATAEHEKDIPVDLSNKGVGPVKSITLEPEINREMADKGKKLFQSQCVSCHMEQESYLGPAMAGVTKVRSPEWIMNMILAPEEMLAKDTIARALLKKYLTPMTNAGLTEPQARDILEYLRTL